MPRRQWKVHWRRVLVTLGCLSLIVRHGALAASVNESCATQGPLALDLDAPLIDVVSPPQTNSVTPTCIALTSDGARAVKRVGAALVATENYAVGVLPLRISLMALESGISDDFCVADQFTGQVYFWKAGQNGTFQFHQAVSASPDMSDTAPADVDADGRSDLFLTYSDTEHPLVLIKNQFGTLLVATQTGLPTGFKAAYASGIHLAGDDSTDLVVSATDTPLIRVFRTTPTGLEAATALTSHAAASRVCVGDLDQDGLQDVVAVGGFGNPTLMGCSVFFQEVNGQFAPPAFYETKSDPKCGVIGDIDGDETNDLLFPNSGGVDCSIFRGLGGRILLPDEPMPVGQFPVAATLISDPASSYPEVAVANGGSRSLWISSYGTNGTTPVSIPLPGTEVFVGSSRNAADLQDHLVAVSRYPNRIVRMVVPPDGPPTSVGMTELSFPPSGRVAIGPRAATDLILFEESSDTLRVFRFTNGRFEQVQAFATGVSPVDLVVADVNDDQLPDLTLASRSPNQLISYLALNDSLLSNTPIQTPLGSIPWRLEIGNLDDDPFPDVVVSTTASSILLLQGNGGGGFIPRGARTFENLSVGGALPLSADSHDQVVVVTRRMDAPGAEARVFDPDELETANPIAVGVSDLPRDMWATDCDQSGLSDLCLLGYQSGLLDLLIQANGAGWEHFSSIGIGAEVQNGTFGDFDGDNLVDFAGVNNAGSDLRLLKSTGPVPTELSTFSAFQREGVIRYCWYVDRIERFVDVQIVQVTREAKPPDPQAITTIDVTEDAGCRDVPSGHSGAVASELWGLLRSGGRTILGKVELFLEGASPRSLDVRSSGGALEIRMTGPDIAGSTARVMDVTGSPVLSATLDGSGFHKWILRDEGTVGVRSGVYFVVVSGNGWTLSRKVVLVSSR